jgi:hypothetical protein
VLETRRDRVGVGALEVLRLGVDRRIRRGLPIGNRALQPAAEVGVVVLCPQAVVIDGERGGLAEFVEAGQCQTVAIALEQSIQPVDSGEPVSPFNP